MKRVSALASMVLTLAMLVACGGGGGSSTTTSSNSGGSGNSGSSSSSSSGGASGKIFQYGDNSSTNINVSVGVQDSDGSASFKLDDKTVQIHFTATGDVPINDFTLTADTQGATLQICQNGTGLFNLFPVDATPVTNISEIAGKSFFSVSLCTTANFQGDYLYFNSNGSGIRFDAAKGGTSFLLPSDVNRMLDPNCVATTENCLRIFRFTRNNTPYYAIHAPWPGRMRLWQGPGLLPF